MEGEFDRAGHDEFLTRILADGATDLIAFQCDGLQIAFGGAQGGADAGRARAYDNEIEDVTAYDGRSIGQSLCNHVDAIAALVHGILDKSEAAEFARDGEGLDAGLKVGRQEG